MFIADFIVKDNLVVITGIIAGILTATSSMYLIQKGMNTLPPPVKPFRTGWAATVMIILF